MADDRLKPLDRLREPFPPEHVGQLPRANVTLDYVGHGAVTDRLLEVDPEWNWEPVATDERGLPLFVQDRNGNPVGLWVRLTVCGVTRLGFGSCPGNQFDAEKVLIGDALRNAAMRFGVALDLWIRGHAEDDEKVSQSRRREEPAEPTADEALLVGLRSTIDALDDDAKAALREAWKHAGLPSPKGALTVSQYDTALGLLDGLETAVEAAESDGNAPAAPLEPDEVHTAVLAQVAERDPDYVQGWSEGKGVEPNAEKWDAETQLAWFSEHIEEPY